MTTNTRAALLMAVTALIWSSGGLAIKLIDLHPMALTGARSALSALTLAALMRGRLRFSFTPATWGAALGYAGLLVTNVAATKLTTSANAILLAFLALVTTMDSPTMGHALDRLGVPPKLVFLFLFTYRYLHVIAAEWQRLVTAARLRGFAPRTGMHTYRTIGYLLGMVLVMGLV